MNDLISKKYGRLLVTSRNGSDKYKKSRWMCICDCGNSITVTGVYLTNGDTKSCGCLKKEGNRKTHGMIRSPEYSVWCDMKKRCYLKSGKSYKNYGGRGISVCDRWLNSFEAFYEDMGERPSEKHTIDRNDNNDGYSPENCSWETQKAQMNNVRYNHMMTFKGETRTMMQWSEITGIRYSTIRSRVNNYGWSDKRALTKK